MAPQPIKRVQVGDRSQLKVAEEVDRLRGLGWRELRREATELDVPKDVVEGAKEQDDIRLAILEEKLRRQL